ncbi:hypothetical protein EPD60_01165 [Flaviaesturariibacter flavus]|uniref:TIGR03067 domain-containing protein n=1 Tax=Flaviaesturariibacter flavus TaxID=2502780 RepID=A0A4R1BP04_9BACT|nr:hypothetical protein [Flaviaesturariibacter flavus]TCJ19056.1 hypothetical protein EPD60_01165 [Flaviaesturariibacter flavus]
MKPFGVIACLFCVVSTASGVSAQGAKTSLQPRKTAPAAGRSLPAKQGVSGKNTQGAIAANAGGPSKTVTGIWRGYFVTEAGEQYKLEFQVAQNGKMTQGVSYSFLDTRFYGKSSMSGTFFAADNKFRIEELRTVEVRNLGGGGTCLMNYNLTFSQSGKELFLEGTYLGKREDRANPKNNGTWGDCGSGRVYLRRVETTEFPVEAFLKKKPVPRADTVARVKPPVKQAPPVVKRTTPATPPRKPATTPPVAKASPKTDPPATGVTRNNTVQRDPAADVVHKADLKPMVIPVQTRNRQNNTARILDVHHEEILVKLYDNGEIDDDTISVYLDNKLILASKRLSASPIELRVKLDEDHPEHTLVMVAENMGRIPPNTSLMIVWDGETRHEVQITSTEQKNAMVRFRLQKGSETAATQ